MMCWVIEMMMLVAEMDMFLAQKLNKKNHQETQEWLHFRVQHIVFQLWPFYRTVTEKRWLRIRQWRWNDNVCWYVCSLWSLCWKSIFWNSFYSIKKYSNTPFWYFYSLKLRLSTTIVKYSTAKNFDYVAASKIPHPSTHAPWPSTFLQIAVQHRSWSFTIDEPSNLIL